MSIFDNTDVSTVLDANEESLFETLAGCKPGCPCPRCSQRRREERQARAVKRRDERRHNFKRMALREQRDEDRRLREDAEVAQKAWERGDLPSFIYDVRVYY